MIKRFALGLLVAATLMPGLASPAAARDGERDDNNGIQLALGDSVAFGYSPLLLGQAHNPSVFVGYPEIVAQRLDLQDVNPSCPGETSGGFLSLTNGQDFVCKGYRSLHPLHVAYSTSQLDYAISFLKSHHHVRLVTLDIGANDIFKLQHICASAPNPTLCVNNGLPATLDRIQTNVSSIYNQIRNVADYDGRLVGLTYYSLKGDPATIAGTHLLNDSLIRAARPFHAKIADGFDAFRDAEGPTGDPCAAGLLIVVAPGVCDVHPSPKGRDLLADAIIQALHSDSEGRHN